MTTFTDPFGGSTVQPAEVSYRAVALAASVVLSWPFTATDVNYVARIMDVTASVASLTLTMPDARQASTGADLVLFNPGANAFNLLDSSGGVICTVQPGQGQYVYLKDSSTAAGIWGVVQFASLASSVNAASLAGPGIGASGAALYAAMVVATFSANYTVLTTDRAKVFVWTGGAGSITLPLAGTATNDFFISVINQGTGVLTVTPAGVDTIDGASNIQLAIDESCDVHSSGGSAWYTVGRGRSTQFNFTLLSKAVASGTYTLTVSEAANVVQKYTGTLTGATTIVLPSAVQVYYVSNETTGAYTLTFKTSGVGSTIAVPSGQNAVLFCDGLNVINASTTVSGISSLTLSQGAVTSPAINFSGDTQTGIYQPTTGAVAFAVVGVQRLLANTTGVSVTGTLGVSGMLSATGGVTGALTGNASTATALATPRAINGVNFDGTAAITVAAAAGTLTGTTLAAGVTGSSLTSVGTLTGLTTSGNASIGVAGATATRTTLQIGAYGTIDDNGGTGLEVNSNAVYNAGWKYIASAAASQYYQQAGTHTWAYAGAGAAGGAIAWTTGMSLDAAGHLTVSGNLDATDYINLNHSSTRQFQLWYPTNSVRFEALGASNELSFATNGGVRMQIDAAGNAALGTTPQPWQGTVKAFGVNTNANVYAYNAATNLFCGLSNNVYIDSGFVWRYIATDTSLVAKYQQDNSGHSFAVAAGGSAGAAITWTPSLQITTAGVIQDGAGNELGYKGLPSASVTTGAFAAADRGKIVWATGGVTIPNSVMSAGDVVAIQNTTGSAITITASITTLRQTGTTNTGNRTLAAYGSCVVKFQSGTVGWISGDLT
jgi:hypothetical protein